MEQEIINGNLGLIPTIKISFFVFSPFFILWGISKKWKYFTSFLIWSRVGNGSTILMIICAIGLTGAVLENTPDQYRWWFAYLFWFSNVVLATTNIRYWNLKRDYDAPGLKEFMKRQHNGKLENL